MTLRRPPKTRRDIYDLYWIFAARRHAIFERRAQGAGQPWTDDPILTRFKFCNVFRAADRVSQYLIRHVAYSPQDIRAADRLFQIVAFRTFSKVETWEGILRHIGHAPTLEDLRRDVFEAAVERLRVDGNRLYTGAFILCANKAFGHDQKHRNHVALFKHMFLKHAAAERILEASSLKQVVEILESFPLIGPFMSYQIALDLNYSDYVNFDEDDYTQAGPGALRGIRKVFCDPGDYASSDIISMMVERQREEFSRLGLSFNGLWGRPLHAIDCQGLFCEVDKYCREAAPHLLSDRTRIKARFSASEAPLPLFFPPKWELNHRLPHASAQPDDGARAGACLFD